MTPAAPPISNRTMILVLPGLLPSDKLKSHLDGKRIVLFENELKFIMSVNMMQLEHASKDAFMDPDHLNYIKNNYGNFRNNKNKEKRK